MIAVEPLLRNGNSAQLSLVSGHDWGWCNLNTFTDIWSAGLNGSVAGCYSEAWLYFPITDWLQLGGISCFSWDFALKPQITVFLGAKFNL